MRIKAFHKFVVNGLYVYTVISSEVGSLWKTRTSGDEDFFGKDICYKLNVTKVLLTLIEYITTELDSVHI